MPVCAHVCGCGSQENVGCLLLLSTLICETVSHWTRSWPFWQGWLASKFPGSAVSMYQHGGWGGGLGGVLEAVCSQPVLTWVWIFRLKSSCLESKLSHLPRSYSLFFKGIFFRNIYFLIMWTGPYLKHKPWCVLYKYDQKFMDRDLKRNWKKLLSI